MVETKRALELYIRIPPWCERQSLAVTVNGHAAGVALADDDYLTVGSLAAGSRVEVTFAQPVFVTQERALGYTQPYRVRWIGNTVAAMSGAGGPMPLYPPLNPAE